MSLPLGSDETTFEQFLQELPADFREWAIEFKAFCRPRQIKTPEPRLRVVMNDCGLDAALREVAGDFTRLEERISDPAIHRRWPACGPWVKAWLGRMMGEAAQPLLAGRLRFLILEGTTVQSPGATGTEDRPQVTIDWVNLHWVQGVVTDEPVGEHLNHAPLPDGDGVVLDRGDHPVGLWIDQADRGVSRVVRDNPHGLNLYEVDGRGTDRGRPDPPGDDGPGILPAGPRAGSTAEGLGSTGTCMVAHCHRPQRPRPAVGSGLRRKKKVANPNRGPWPWPPGS
jgi:hypothetical protein